MGEGDTITFYRVHLTTRSKSKLLTNPLVWREHNGVTNTYTTDLGNYRTLEEADTIAQKLSGDGVKAEVIQHCFRT